MAARTTRRAVIAGAGSIAALVATSAKALIQAEGNPDAVIFRLCNAYERSRAAMAVASEPHNAAELKYFALRDRQPDSDEDELRKLSGLNVAEPPWTQAVDANEAVIDDLTDARPRTFQGLLMKARIAVREPCEARLQASVVADLAAMEGAA